MEYDRGKVDEMVLALMWLVIHGDKYGRRAWKIFDWDTLDRLYEKGTFPIQNQRQNRLP